MSLARKGLCTMVDEPEIINTDEDEDEFDLYLEPSDDEQGPPHLSGGRK